MGGSLSEEPLNAFELNIQRQLEKRGIPVTPAVRGRRVPAGLRLRSSGAARSDGAGHRGGWGQLSLGAHGAGPRPAAGSRCWRTWAGGFTGSGPLSGSGIRRVRPTLLWRRGVTGGGSWPMRRMLVLRWPVQCAPSRRLRASLCLRWSRTAGRRPVVSCWAAYCGLFHRQSLVALARWLNSDTLLRTDDELLRGDAAGAGVQAGRVKDQRCDSFGSSCCPGWVGVYYFRSRKILILQRQHLARRCPGLGSPLPATLKPRARHSVVQ